MELTENSKTQAANELREDETRKVQGLVQFREWISKQDHIKNPRTDDNHLLKFLRVKKYANADAFKMYERLLIGKETNPEWFENLSLEDEKMRELFESGYCIPLKECDASGCRVILFRSRLFDIKRFNEHCIYKMCIWVVLNLLEDPNTQVSGIKFVWDYKDTKMEVIAALTLSNMKKILTCLQNAVPCRQKLSLWINFPAAGVSFADIAKTFVQKKLADRALFFSDAEKLLELFDVKILPKEYGGEVPICEMLDSFKAFVDSNKENIKSFDEQSIDLSRVVDYKAEPVESFKKLEID